MEDEALRGDFMLRWAVVLLALMLGCTEIRDSAALVRIRTGKYLASHGWLPPATDVFSYTAAEQPWRNISWLGDLLLAGLFHVGGGNTLSIAAGIIAASGFWLLTLTTRPGISTWWGSACAALGLLAVFPLMTIGPDLFTIVGLAAVASILARLESDADSRAIWAIPVVLMIWAHLDEHAFLGLVLLIAYSVGNMIDARSEDAVIPMRRMWACVGASTLAMMLHPFHVHTLMGAVSLHTDVYPAHALYASAGPEFQSRWLPLTDPDFWQTLTVPLVAGLLIAVVALVTMLLNASRLRWSHALVWLAINGLAIVAGRQLFAAAVVNVVLAALNGQDWYRSRFRLTYSVETKELIFSRGGRAVTVVALFALGYLAVSGRLMGPHVRRIGIGFDAQLSARIDSLRDVLDDSLDDRPFNFRLEQGDLLIWIDQRPFIDSRLGIYAGADPSLTDLHRRIRPALLSANPAFPDRGKTEVWQEAFEHYGVTHVLPRLWGESPDYDTFIELMVAPRWRLARLGAATAAIYDYESSQDGVQEYIEQHQGADFAGQAFRDLSEDDVLTSQAVWPLDVTVYEELLTENTQRVVSNDIQVARHYAALLGVFRGRISESELVALSHLVIRHAWRGLAEQPNAVEGYLALADAYRYLLEVHQIIQQEFGKPSSELLRRRDIQQVQAALMNAVACRPEEKQIRLVLAQFLFAQQKSELALEHMREYGRLNGNLATVEPDDPNYEASLEQNQEAVAQLQATVQQFREELEVELLADTPLLQVVGQAVNNGMTVEALRLLEEDATVVAQDVMAQFLQARLLIDVGRIEEATRQLENMERPILESAPFLLMDWSYATAVANLAVGNYQRANELWNDQAERMTVTQLHSLLGFSPQPGEVPSLSSNPMIYSPSFFQDMKPILRSRIFGDLLLSYAGRWSDIQVQNGLALLQQGRVEEATQILAAVLDSDPETEFRPLIAFYLTIVTGESPKFTSPSDEIPVTAEMFASDPEAAGLDSPQP